MEKKNNKRIIRFSCRSHLFSSFEFGKCLSELCQVLEMKVTLLLSLEDKGAEVEKAEKTHTLRSSQRLTCCY